MYESFGFNSQQIKRLLGKEIQEFLPEHQEYMCNLLQQLAQLRELEKQSQSNFKKLFVNDV